MTDPAVGAFGVRQGKPGVHGEQRDLDGKAQHQGQQHDRLDVGGHLHGRAGQCLDVEGPQPLGLTVVQHDVDQAGQRDDRAGEGVEEELRRRPLAVARAEEVDEHVHRQQRELEADVEAHQVGGGEHADHRRLQARQPAVEDPLVLPHGREAAEDADRAQQHGQCDQQQGHAVDAHAQAQAQLVDPTPRRRRTASIRPGPSRSATGPPAAGRRARGCPMAAIVRAWRPGASAMASAKASGVRMSRCSRLTFGYPLTARPPFTTAPPGRSAPPARPCRPPCPWRSRAAARSGSAAATGPAIEAGRRPGPPGRRSRACRRRGTGG
ncbi:MAG: hypothetical protein KatS3mg103_0529 [Phycisphaerales bacterium]|nr:MAG: hypothetical protein KatS3mg103_0529 [Phycisphaerales bacterium]